MILPRDVNNLVARYYCYNNNYYNGYNTYSNCHSAWYRWGRWVLAGVLILAGLFFLLIAGCCLMRRRRRARNYNNYPAATPAPQMTGYNNGPAYGAPQQETYAPPPGPPVNGYYGQQTGIAQPGAAYQPK